MAITPQNAKILWANAAGRCAFPDCGKRLTGSTNGNHYTLGEMAHIKGDKPDANRHDPSFLEPDLSAYPNLVLMCRNHHRLIDTPENEELYSVDMLHQFKGALESFIENRLRAAVFSNKYEVAKHAMPILQENHAVFTQYGPLSEMARRNPESEANHALWQEERLCTLVPNNLNVLSLLEENIEYFNTQETAVINQFKLHVRSYQSWVEAEHSYEIVLRFPLEFFDLITELSNASTQ